MVLSASAVSAAEFPAPNTYRAMTPADPFWSFGDSNGQGSVQVRFDMNSPFPVQLGWRLSGRARDLCETGGNGTVRITVDLERNGKRVFRDFHENESCNYQAHPAGKVGLAGSKYQMKVTESFRLELPSAIGTATVRATANFEIP